MIKPIAVKTVYSVYNLLNDNRINNYYDKTKFIDENIGCFETSFLNTYLINWGFNPVLEKNPLMGRHEILEWTKKVDESKIKSWAYTGGSYGEPLRIPYSKKRDLIRTATFKYYNEIGGYKLGDPFLLIRAKDKSPLIKFLRNENIFIPKDISETRIRLLIDELKKKKVKILMGYPTVIFELALFFLRNPAKKEGLAIKSIITVSEPLEYFKRQLIYDVFKCNFVDRYSNEEVGLIAQQREFGGEYFVNQFGVYVEVVDPDHLLPVKEGQQGKVVVTDIYNDLIPVVRYDTGDLATVNRYENGHLISIKNIIGRVTEQITDVNGIPVSPLALGPFIYKPLSRQGQVCQYQFAQITDSIYELRIKTKEGDISSILTDEIIYGLENALGIAAKVHLKIVDEINPLPSGKRPVFKNETSLVYSTHRRNTINDEFRLIP